MSYNLMERTTPWPQQKSTTWELQHTVVPPRYYFTTLHPPRGSPKGPQLVNFHSEVPFPTSRSPALRPE